MMHHQKKLTAVALVATGLATAILVACDADDDVPIIVGEVDSGSKPVPVVDSGTAADTGTDATTSDAKVDSAAPDGGSDGATTDAKND